MGLYSGSPMMGRPHQAKGQPAESPAKLQALGMNEKKSTGNWMNFLWKCDENSLETWTLSSRNSENFYWIFFDAVDEGLPPRLVLWPTINHNTPSQIQVLTQPVFHLESIRKIPRSYR